MIKEIDEDKDNKINFREVKQIQKQQLFCLTILIKIIFLFV